MKKRTRIKLKGKGGVRSFAISNNGRLIVVAQHGLKAGDPILTVLDAGTLEMIEIIERFDENSLYAVAFTADDTGLLYSKDDYLVQVLDTGAWNLINSIETSHNRNIIASVSSADKAICLGKYLDVWNIDQDDLLFRLDGYEAFKVTEAGKVPAGVSWSDNKIAPCSFIADPPVACFSAKSDNRIYYTGINVPRIFSLDLEAKKTEVLIEDGVLQASAIKVSNGDKYIAVSSRVPQRDFVWNIETGMRVAPSLISDKYRAASVFDFHSSGSMLAWGSIAGFLTIVDMEKEEVCFSEKIHDARINQVQYIENGTKIMTAANDGKLLITALPLQA